jgi:phosphatidylinositol-3-phosphatase
MKRIAWLLPVTAIAIAACGGNGSITTTGTGAGGTVITGTGGSASTSTTTGTGGSTGTTSTTGTGGSTTSTTGTGGSTTSTTGTGGSTTSTSTSTSSGMPCGTCPTGYTCGTANNLPVCRAPSGVPLFSNVFLIMMENTSLSTLQAAMNASPSHAPNLQAMAAAYATGSDYHGAAHPSLPNYIALTSGSTQSIECDCKASPTLASGGTSCFLAGLHDDLICNLLVGGCSCDQPSSVMNIADQLEAAGKSWMAFGESMGTPCNTTDSGNYAVRHVPFLYYDSIQTNASRCNGHVVDFSNFSPSAAAAYNFIAPNLIDDMHNPDPTTSVNIPDGDTWIGPQVTSIMASPAYTHGGLLVVVWDEDDDSGGITGTDDPIEIFVMSPYAKAGGYVSSVTANHYSLLATIEDGLDLPYLGMASSPGNGIAATLSDFFPAN